MPGLALQVERYSVVITIGAVSVKVNTADPNFLAMLEDRYAGFVNPGFVNSEARAEFEFDVDLVPRSTADPDVDVSVKYRAGRWFMERGDFRAEWDPAARRGWIRQTANPYSIDAVLRIVHTLVLAKQGGFLLHSASAIRNGKAFLFAGVSGAGKTTISRLAPPDATLLTDEISYVRKLDDGYVAYGTPFTGELAKLGENTSARVAALYLLAKGENRIEPVAAPDAGRELLANMLFFAEDQEMVHRAFQAACDFVHRVPVYRLTFVPDARVWEMIG
ncbi:MAG: hypothetical protein ABSA78_04430 [Candidatus Sulfotelmatobacter sp.]